jgi:predicted polyphosphate/ATP-dependent NAD kinase
MNMTDNSGLSLFRLGLIVNPVAGIGGPSALKGSDHPDTLQIARSRGVDFRAEQRVLEMLAELSGLLPQIKIITASGAMGAGVCAKHPHTDIEIVYQAPEYSSASDTIEAARLIHRQRVDLLVFVGGDGTARDVYTAIGSEQTVLGLPAGVKMHSAVFAVTPKAVASVIESMMNHRLVAARMAEVRDIDEQAFAQGQVKTRYFGEMLIPDDQLLVQAVKCSGLLDDELMLDELCVYLHETQEDDCLYILGSGGTLKRLKETFGILEPTLLGVDLWYQGAVIAKDAHEQQIFEIIQRYPRCKIMLSVIGGQGVVLGRGNQQISPRIIEHCGIDSVQFISTQSKLLALEGRPLKVDSGSNALNRELAGYHKIICGYEDFVLYEIAYV